MRTVACRRELVNTAAQAVGSMWEAAAACDACKGYMPLLVLEFLRGRCAGAPGVISRCTCAVCAFDQ